MKNYSLRKIEKKFLPPCIISTIILGFILISLNSNSIVFAQDNNWHVGEGVKKNMYATYKISDLDTNNGQPYTMTIYFKEQDENGNWIAPVNVVEPRGNVMNGTFVLISLDLTALDTSNITSDMSKYRNSYSNTLKWLSAFVAKPGQSLSATSWGKTASIGGPEIKPSGIASIKVPAFSEPVQTTSIIYYKGVESNIRILNEFPYPIKAKTFADVTTGNPPVQYEYELIETGEGQPTGPIEQTIVATPQLLQRTATGQYFVQLFWDPQPIEVGQEVRFGILFMGNNQMGINNVNYDFRIFNSTGAVLFEEENRQASTGTDIVSANFTNPRNVRVNVEVNTINGIQVGDFKKRSSSLSGLGLNPVKEKMVEYKVVFDKEDHMAR